MPLLTMATAATLFFAPPPALDVAGQQPFHTAAVAETNLAEVHGRQLPTVGLDQAESAGEASAIAVGSIAPNPADTIRELTDNWTLDVATPLIAAALSPRP